MKRNFEMKSHSREIFIDDTMTIQRVMSNLGANESQIKKYVKQYNIPYIKIGHRWRFTRESYELLKEKLTCRSTTINEVNTGKLKAKFGLGNTVSALDKVQKLIKKGMQSA